MTPQALVSRKLIAFSISDDDLLTKVAVILKRFSQGDSLRIFLNSTRRAGNRIDAEGEYVYSQDFRLIQKLPCHAPSSVISFCLSDRLSLFAVKDVISMRKEQWTVIIRREDATNRTIRGRRGSTSGSNFHWMSMNSLFSHTAGDSSKPRNCADNDRTHSPLKA
jgi:hypothetical protein